MGVTGLFAQNSRWCKKEGVLRKPERGSLIVLFERERGDDRSGTGSYGSSNMREPC